VIRRSPPPSLMICFSPSPSPIPCSRSEHRCQWPCPHRTVASFPHMRQNGFAVIAATVVSRIRLSVTGHCYMTAVVPATASLPLHIPTAMTTTPSDSHDNF
ncbi:hypothetical protein L195_g053121, partial [Trifolium pratense]